MILSAQEWHRSHVRAGEPSESAQLRVILLADGETVHNAFFDRSFQP
jgi:hypothetical protein